MGELLGKSEKNYLVLIGSLESCVLTSVDYNLFIFEPMNQSWFELGNVIADWLKIIPSVMSLFGMDSPVVLGGVL